MGPQVTGLSSFLDRRPEGYRSYIIASQAFLLFNAITGALWILLVEDNTGVVVALGLIFLGLEIVCAVIAYYRRSDGSGSSYEQLFLQNWAAWRVEMIFCVAVLVLAFFPTILYTVGTLIMNAIIGFQALKILQAVFTMHEASPAPKGTLDIGNRTQHPDAPDKFALVARLNDLRNQGGLTDQEFEDAKKRILSAE